MKEGKKGGGMVAVRRDWWWNGGCEKRVVIGNTKPGG